MGRKPATRGGLLAVSVSVIGHALVLSALLFARGEPPPVEPDPIVVSMVKPPPPPPPPEIQAAPTTAEPSPAPARPRSPARPTPAPPDVEPIPTAKVPTPELVAGLGEAELAGAATAGSGSGGGGCDMIRLLQNALRRNPRIQAAIARAHPEAAASGKAILVWNGDWVRSTRQEGKGLAGVRQVIVMEIAFAPEACRADRVRGLVLVSMSDAPGAARLALGAGNWRWSDLVFAR